MSERIGLTRAHPSLPTVERQGDILTTIGRCDALIEVERGVAGDKRLEKTLATLGAGTTVCVVSIDAFGRPIGDLVRLLRDLAELSISVAIVGGAEGETVIRPKSDVIELLRQLSACSGRSHGATGEGARWYGRSFRSATQFNRHQVLHARKLYGEGLSLRAIGLIFETSPEEVWKVVS